MESLARKLTTDDIAEFLTAIGLPQYAESFKNEDVTGDELLAADIETLVALGVTDSLHQMEIKQKFRRKLQGIIITTVVCFYA